MRLRLTVKRNGLPDAPVVWTVESAATTISKLLEEVHGAIPIESGDWGFEDYAVELRGANGVNFECLHYQTVGKVFKEDDEVIIRPLLTQDLKVRKISGRHQISADGKHLVDGLAFGRPLLRQPADRPSVNIPPRKKRRITYNVLENDDELELEDEISALEKREALDDSEPGSNDDRQLVLHADFDDDDDSEEDGDFVPGGDEEVDDSDGSSELDWVLEPQDSEEPDEQESDRKEAMNDVEQEKITSSLEIGKNALVTAKNNEEALRGAKNVPTQAKIRKLHAAFPTSSVAVCRHVLSGSQGDIGQAYEALVYGFRPIITRSAITETLQDDLAVSKKCNKLREPVAERSGYHVGVDVAVEEESDESQESNNSLVGFYDQNGLPSGSISSGKALSFMAEALGTSPLCPTSSGSVKINKRTLFEEEETLANELASTPFIDRKPHFQSEKVNGSSNTSSSGVSSSEDESEGETESTSDSDDSSESARDSSGESSSGSSSPSDSSSDSSSDSEDDSPEETSSKPRPATSVTTQKLKGSPTQDRVSELEARKPVAPGSGKKSTQSRNQRRRRADVINRFVKRGILPAGFTVAEFIKLDLKGEATDAQVLAALETLKLKEYDQKSPSTTGALMPELFDALSQPDEFEARKQRLLDELAAGGVEVGSDSAKKPQVLKPSHNMSGASIASEKSHVTVDIVAEKSVVSSSGVSDEVHAYKIKSTSVNCESNKTSEAVLKPTPIGSVKSEKLLVAAQTSPLSDAAIPNSSATPKSKNTTKLDKSAESSERRSKLDIDAVQRMLFGSLGKRAPKSKLDQDKLRDDLMKGVRPISNPKQREELVQEATGQDEDDSIDTWKNKINYRAVECCHEGVKLSVPPFPFVQRWDPQQQGEWSHNGTGRGKRKQDQRDQPQFYDESRASKKQKQRKANRMYAQEQEYLDDTNEPSYEENSLAYGEEPTRERGVPNDDNDADVTQQLLDDLNVNASNGADQEPDDLVSLPDDPSILPDLLPDQARQGMTIAFKQLVMTAETNWQPLVSVYRTAIVIDKSENGEIEVILAKRDQQQPTVKTFDENTGQRIYGKFEMPVDENDEDNLEPEHGGKLSLKHEEMMEPKVVQQPPEDDDALNGSSEHRQNPTTDGSATLSQEGESADPEAQLSHITETPLQSNSTSVSQAEVMLELGNDGPPALDKEVHYDPPPASELFNIPVSNLFEAQNNLNLPQEETARHDKKLGGQVSREVAMANDCEFPNLHESISDTSRERISHMIQEAGFGSSVSSSINRIIRPDGMESPGDAALFDKLMMEMSETPIRPPYSPKFNGIGSSSPIRKLRDLAQSPSKDDHQNMSSPPQPQSSWQTIGFDEPSSPVVKSNDSHDLVEPVVNDYGDEESWEGHWEEEQIAQSSPPEHRGESIKKEISNLLATSALPEIRRIWEQSKQPNTSNRSVRTSIGVTYELPGPLLVPNIPSDVVERETNDSIVHESAPLSIISTAGPDQIEYPKLSVGSSFTSHVSDHGRQPDAEFDDSAALNADTPKAPTVTEISFESADDSSHPDAVFEHGDDELINVDPELELPPSCQPTNQRILVCHQASKSDSEPKPISQDAIPLSDSGHRLTNNKFNCPVCHCNFLTAEDVEAHISACLDDTKLNEQSEASGSSFNAFLPDSSPLLEDAASSEVEGLESEPESHLSSKASTGSPEPFGERSSDDFPDIDEVLATSQREREKITSICNAREDQAAPEPSQCAPIPRSRSSVPVPFRAPKVHISQSQAPPPMQTRASLPKTSSSQPLRPKGAQRQSRNTIVPIPKNVLVWDLTMSSDVEPELEKDEPNALDIQSKTLKADFKRDELNGSSQAYVEGLQAKPRRLNRHEVDYPASDLKQMHTQKGGAKKRQSQKRKIETAIPFSPSRKRK